MRALRKQDEGTRQSPEGHGLRAKGHKKPVSAPKYLWLCGHPVSQDVKRIAACRCTPICGPPSAQQALYRLKGTHFLPGFSWECHYLFSLLTASEHTVFMHLHSVTSWAKTARNDTLQAASKEQGSGTEYLTLRQNRTRDKPSFVAAPMRQMCGSSLHSQQPVLCAPIPHVQKMHLAIVDDCTSRQGQAHHPHLRSRAKCHCTHCCSTPVLCERRGVPAFAFPEQPAVPRGQPPQERHREGRRRCTATLELSCPG